MTRKEEKIIINKEIIKIGGDRVRISSLPHGCVGTTPNRMHVLKWFEVAANRGLDGVEVMDNWVMSGLMQGINRDLQKRIEEKLSDLPLEVSAFINHGPYVWSSAKMNKLELDKVKFFMDWASVLDTKIFRVTTAIKGGAIMTNDEARGIFVDMIQECLPYAAEHGLVIALEEHPGFAGTITKIELILDRIRDRRFGVAFDMKNTLREGENPLVILDKKNVLDRVLYTHVDNFKYVPSGGRCPDIEQVGESWWYRSVTLQEGDVDIKTLVQGLKRNGYDGWLSVEYGGTNLEHVFKSIEWLKSVWNSC